MDFIIKGRGTGRTSDLIRMSARTKIPIVAVHPDYVEDKAKEYGLDIPKPISMYHYFENPPKEVYIDDADIVLNQLLRTKVVAISAAVSQDLPPV